jgi:hypothetical protein
LSDIDERLAGEAMEREEGELSRTPSPAGGSSPALQNQDQHHRDTTSIYTETFSDVSECDCESDSNNLSATTSFSGPSSDSPSSSLSSTSPKSASLVNSPTAMCCQSDDDNQWTQNTRSYKLSPGVSKKKIKIRKNALYTKLYQGGPKKVIKAVNSKNIISRCWPHFAKFIASNIRRKYSLKAEKEIVSVHNELLIKVQKNSRYSPCGTISNVDQLKDIMHTYSSSSDELISSSEEELSSSEDVTSSDCDSDYDYD